MSDITERLRNLVYLEQDAESVMEAADEIDRLRAELAEAKAQRVPDGYVLIPKGPNPDVLFAMIEAFGDGNGSCGEHVGHSLSDAIDAYQVVVAAGKPVASEAQRVPDDLRECLVAWWQSHRPVDWCEATHLKIPAVNCVCKVDASLARSVAAMLAASQKEGKPAAPACQHGIRHPHPCRECEDAPLTPEQMAEVESWVAAAKEGK